MVRRCYQQNRNITKKAQIRTCLNLPKASGVKMYRQNRNITKKKAKIHKGSNHYSVGGTKTLPTQHDYDENMLKFVQVLTFKRGVVQTH